MSLRIATNIQSLTAQRFLNNNHDLQNKSLEKLASGVRINHAGDDAAGLAISERMRANVRSMKQATRNAQDGVSLIQTAEGSMNEIGNILIRLRELSIQAASDTVGSSERGFIDTEMQNLKGEINRISHSTEFNGYRLLDGTGKDLDIQVGINNNPLIDRFTYDTPNHMATPEALGVSEVSARSKEEAQGNLAMIDDGIRKLNENRASLGALQNRLASTINNLLIYTENIETARSRIMDSDIAEETAELTKRNILTQANTSVLAQANTNQMIALKLLGG